MIWLILAYAAAAYYWFWMTLRHVQPWDMPSSILLNAILALLIGPHLLVFTLVLRCGSPLRSTP